MFVSKVMAIDAILVSLDEVKGELESVKSKLETAMRDVSCLSQDEMLAIVSANVDLLDYIRDMERWLASKPVLKK